MSEINDGGPAFPHFKEDAWGNARVVGGMSLRDWFAGQALNGLLSSTEPAPNFNTIEEVLGHYSTTAYRYADDMLKAREGSQ